MDKRTQIKSNSNIINEFTTLTKRFHLTHTLTYIY